MSTAHEVLIRLCDGDALMLGLRASVDASMNSTIRRILEARKEETRLKELARQSGAMQGEWMIVWRQCYGCAWPFLK